MYKGTWRGELVAIKELKQAELAFGGLSDEEDALARRNAYEEFRHEVWIMRFVKRFFSLNCM